jgi:hypothetical protein
MHRKLALRPAVHDPAPLRGHQGSNQRHTDIEPHIAQPHVEQHDGYEHDCRDDANQQLAGHETSKASL